MVTVKHNMIYHEIIEVTQDYLGPAASRFIDRSIVNHLKKNPSDITKSDVNKLINWVRVSVAVLTEDADLVSEYIERLKEVGKSTRVS